LRLHSQPLADTYAADYAIAGCRQRLLRYAAAACFISPLLRHILRAMMIFRQLRCLLMMRDASALCYGCQLDAMPIRAIAAEDTRCAASYALCLLWRAIAAL